MTPLPPARLMRHWEARWESLPDNLRGAVWQVLSNLAFTMMAVMVKTVGQSMDSFEIAFFRCLFGLLLTLPFLMRAGRASFVTSRIGAHFSRAALGVAAMFCGFYALTHLPLAEATTISFTKTLFTIPLAVLVFGEAIRWRRWTATLVGLGGVVVILRPQGGEFDPAMLVALLAAALVAVVIMTIKSLAHSERASTILFYYGVFSTGVSLVPALLVWRTPVLEEYVALAGIAVLGVAGQFCNIRSYRLGEATAMAPFGYLRLIFAGFFGYILFAEVPDLWTWVGAAIIVSSTLYIAIQEARRKEAPAVTG
ncbi:MAG: DMT family transporter [Alphaproteobacteria bacterium]|nr:DMT family transporter [Alphaproteobacteria bacterium]